MKLYVATSYGNALAARAFMDRCRAAGFSVPVDWTAPHLMEREQESGLVNCWRDGTAPTGVARRVAAEMALLDARAVADADLLVVIATNQMRGAWVEMGVALGRGVPILFVLPDGPFFGTVFPWHPAVTCVLDADAAFSWLCARCGHAPAPAHKENGEGAWGGSVTSVLPPGDISVTLVDGEDSHCREC